MKELTSLLPLVASFVIGISLGFIQGDYRGIMKIDSLYQMTEKIKSCEAELPRNQSCEIVVTAQIKDIEENWNVRP